MKILSLLTLFVSASFVYGGDPVPVHDEGFKRFQGKIKGAPFELMLLTQYVPTTSGVDAALVKSENGRVMMFIPYLENLHYKLTGLDLIVTSSNIVSVYAAKGPMGRLEEFEITFSSTEIAKSFVTAVEAVFNPTTAITKRESSAFHIPTSRQESKAPGYASINESAQTNNQQTKPHLQDLQVLTAKDTDTGFERPKLTKESSAELPGKIHLIKDKSLQDLYESDSTSRGTAWQTRAGVADFRTKEETKSFLELVKEGKQRYDDVADDKHSDQYYEANYTHDEYHCYEQIVKDVPDRVAATDQEKEALTRILCAYSVFDQRLRFCQGMDNIALTLLRLPISGNTDEGKQDGGKTSKISEEDAFWLLATIYHDKKYKLSNYARIDDGGTVAETVAEAVENLMELQEGNDALQKMLEFPKAMNNLTFFVYSLTHKIFQMFEGFAVKLDIYDMFIESGWPGLVRAIVALVNFASTLLLEKFGAANNWKIGEMENDAQEIFEALPKTCTQKRFRESLKAIKPFEEFDTIYLRKLHDIFYESKSPRKMSTTQRRRKYQKARMSQMRGHSLPAMPREPMEGMNVSVPRRSKSANGRGRSISPKPMSREADTGSLSSFLSFFKKSSGE